MLSSSSLSQEVIKKDSSDFGKYSTERLYDSVPLPEGTHYDISSQFSDWLKLDPFTCVT